MRRLLPLALLLTAQVAPPPEAETAFRAHVEFLAADAMNGREAGTRDYDVAAEYVAARMLAAGLEPATPRGWFQRVPLMTAKPAGEPTMALSGGAGGARPLAFGTDFTLERGGLTGAFVDLADVPVVFAGHGVVDAAMGRDDYRGLDVRGKVVALIRSGPKGEASDVAAHLGSRLDRAKLAKARGAVGVVYLWSAQTERVGSFARRAQTWDTVAVAWTARDGAAETGAPLLGTLSDAGATTLFAGYRVPWSRIRADEDAGRRLPTGALPARLTTRQRFTTGRIESANVVGILRGSDRRLAAEYVVLSAHLDHVGPLAAGEDRIHNGAMDNATGIATLIEAARALAGGPRPKRSIVFAAVTAEEKGLVGSDYLAQHPLPGGRVVADVNFDMPILTYRFRDLVAFGADRSTIGEAAARAARAGGYSLVPDPAPDEASFVRTDHYSFVRAGVPSVSLTPGPGGPGARAGLAFLKEHYHKPSDEPALIDWTAGAAFVRVNVALARDLADAPERPVWKRGDYFGTAYRGPMAR